LAAGGANGVHQARTPNYRIGAASLGPPDPVLLAAWLRPARHDAVNHDLSVLGSRSRCLGARRLCEELRVVDATPVIGPLRVPREPPSFETVIPFAPCGCGP